MYARQSRLQIYSSYASSMCTLVICNSLACVAVLWLALGLGSSVAAMDFTGVPAGTPATTALTMLGGDTDIEILATSDFAKCQAKAMAA